MNQISAIKEHMEVLGSDGNLVGVVDGIEGENRIKLTKNDSPDGEHHYIGADLINRVDEHVHLSKPAETVLESWRSKMSRVEQSAEQKVAEWEERRR
jgi:hypothetical protein